MGLAGAVVATCLGALVAMAASEAAPSSDFHLEGDYMLGGLFSLHSEAVDTPFLVDAKVPLCKKFSLNADGYVNLQAMRFAVEEINNSSLLLPGVSLGYEIFDVCHHTNIIHPLFYVLSNNRSQIEIRRNYTDMETRVMAVIGPDLPRTAITAAYLLSQFLVPQIIYSTTTKTLSNRKSFPVTFRTIPSMEWQIAILLELLKYFQWNWVIILSSRDEYGQAYLQLLLSKLRHQHSEALQVCVAFQETIPVPELGQQTPSAADLQQFVDLIARINNSSAKVVVVLSTEVPLQVFFREAIRQSITGLVWIAVDSWATNPIVYNTANISSVGTILGVAARNVPIPGLGKFQNRSGPTDGKAAHLTCNQECDNCLSMARRFDHRFRAAGDRITFNVYSSVYVLAHALHTLLGCNETGCHKRKVYPWQLLREVGQVNFSLLNTTITFDERGRPPNGFEVVQWQWDDPEKFFRTIATYNPLQEELRVFAEDIAWHTADGAPPKSICSEECGPGQKRLVVGSFACCFMCKECEAGTFLNKSDLFSCPSCPPNMWSNAGQEECFMKTEVFLSWDDPISILLLSFASLGLLTTLGVLGTFVHHFDTPVVRSAGGWLCFLMIASFAAGFCSVCFYIGELTVLRCIGRQTAFSLCFTLCVACITVRSFQIICVFKMAARLPRAYDLWKKYNGQQVFVATAFAVKMVIVGLNLSLYPPAPAQTTVRNDPSALLLMCTTDYRASMVLNNAVEMVLCFLCFCFAYMGKALPKNYNEAKYITVCMTSYFTYWVILFLFMSLSEGLVMNKVDTAIMLSNLFNLCVGYFGPKCYVIFFHPERNTAAFFQTAIQSYTMRQE